MTMRPIRLPDDLIPLGDMLVDTFQYPENEAWSVQSDEQEQIVSSMRNIRRMWPLIRLIQLLSPPLRDILRGYVWQEDGQIAGVTIVQRRGSTDVWIVGTVGVLPAYRRRGIARKLVEAALDLIRERGGKKAWLSVIAGNVPAYKLYEKLGFEHYSGSIEFHLVPEQAPPTPTLPPGYTQSVLGFFDWQPRYELEQRISPETLLRYEPVEKGRFRLPPLMRVFYPLLMLAQQSRRKDFAIRTAATGEMVARGGYTVSTRGKGFNQIELRVDPAHPVLAPYLVGFLLNQAVSLSPGLRVEFSVPRWMDAAVAAAEEAGFERRLEHHRMGIEL
jgi:GNAT superfamily N-acetyltransferase